MRWADRRRSIAIQDVFPFAGDAFIVAVVDVGEGLAELFLSYLWKDQELNLRAEL